jgi:hypothetical protein
MVKVLSRGGQDLKAIGRHLDYLSRKGELDIETDDGHRIAGEEAEQELLKDWNLDLEEVLGKATLIPNPHRKPPKLVHKILFSMPGGTPADKVLAAVKDFAREEFGLKHRYAMVLHTDEPHPHVHVVVKAMGEDGRRLNIQRATLRHWRREFARHLRQQGIEANATERAVRGQIRTSKLDGIYRAALRGDSTHARERIESVAAASLRGSLRAEAGRGRLVETRREVERGWRASRDILIAQGHVQIAAHVGRFLDEMPPVRTERERVLKELQAKSLPPRVR